MNRKQRRIGIKQASKTVNKHKRNVLAATEDQVKENLYRLMEHFGINSSKEEAMNTLKETGEFSLGEGIKFRMVPLQQGLADLQDILANGGTIEYPE